MQVHHVLDVSYVKSASHLEAHLSYVSRKGALAYAFNFTTERIKDFFNFAYEKKAKRKDARVALRMYFALPDSWALFPVSMLKENAEKIVNFLSNQLNVNAEDIMLFFHKPNEKGKNFHVHVVVKYQSKDGKALRIQPQNLRALHKAWDEFLIELGYEPFRLKDYFPELGNVGRALNLPKYVYDDDKNHIAQKVKQVREELKTMAKDFRATQEREMALQLRYLYEASDTLWIMLRNQATGDVLHRKVKVEKLLSLEGKRFIGMLRYYNSQGYDVYITLNSFKEDSTSRKEEEAEDLQDKLYLDIDGDKLGKDGKEILEQIIKESGLPKPTLTVRTSSKNYQAVWKLSEKVKFEELKAVMQLIEQKYGLDHVSDKARVFRLAGFKNKKKERQGEQLDLVLVDRLLSTGRSYSWAEVKATIDRISHARRTTDVVLREKLPPEPTPLKQNLQPPSKQELQPKQEPTELQLYMSILEKEARKHGLQVKLNLTENKSYSEVDFAFAKELLRQAPLWKTVKIMREVITKYRPDKLRRSPNYVSMTITSAHRELRQQQQQQQDKEKQEDNNYYSGPSPP